MTLRTVNVSLDNLSLMALTIATGFVVDDAIVMLENVARHLEEGKSRMQAAFDGARCVGGGAAFSFARSVPGGGLSPDGQRWIACRPRFFLPVRVLSGLFRRLFIEGLLALHRAGNLAPHGHRSSCRARR